MKKYLLVILIVTMLTSPAMAWWNKNDNQEVASAKQKEEVSLPQQEAQQVDSQQQQKKDALIENINTLRNQEIRLAVLQQLLNEEVARLRQTQAVFCDQYNLDPEKFRAGLYVYDNSKSCFVEKDAE